MKPAAFLNPMTRKEITGMVWPASLAPLTKEKRVDIPSVQRSVEHLDDKLRSLHPAH